MTSGLRPGQSIQPSPAPQGPQDRKPSIVTSPARPLPMLGYADFLLRKSNLGCMALTLDLALDLTRYAARYRWTLQEQHASAGGSSASSVLLVKEGGDPVSIAELRSMGETSSTDVCHTAALARNLGADPKLYEGIFRQTKPVVKTTSLRTSF